jgi:hypothetical protein
VINLLIDVTQNDICLGIPCDATASPVALVLGRMYVTVRSSTDVA